MIKNSVGIWAFGPAVTRFVPPGYHHQVTNEPIIDKTKRVAEGLHDLLEGLEYHYPGEVNEDNAEEVLRVLDAHQMDLRPGRRARRPRHADALRARPRGG